MKLRACISVGLFSIACSKQVGVDPKLAYSDRALNDSAIAAQYSYHDRFDSLYAGNFGAHGPFHLRFNGIAHLALTDSGRLPKGSRMPDGSLIVKDVIKNGQLTVRAIMYKRNGSWWWGEMNADGKPIYSMNSVQPVCTGCHGTSPQRDFVKVFSYY